MGWIRMTCNREPVANISVIMVRQRERERERERERDLSVCWMKCKVNLKSLIGSNNYCFACKPKYGIGVYKTLTFLLRDL